MLGKLLSKIIVWALSLTTIKGEDRTRLINALLAHIDALPLRDVVSFDLDGTLLIRGNKLEVEQAQNLKAAVSSLKDNYARKLIQEQLLHEANMIGLHKGLNPEMIQFAKALIWCLQNEQALINKIDEN